MAIVSKTNRDGVDVVIEGLQQRWYAQLLGFWDVNATYQMYPRANKNYRGDQIIPEISLDEKDYSEALMNDKFSITSFFLNNNERTRDQEFHQITHSISIIFQADLVALYGETERMDEVFNMHVLRVIEQENKYVHGEISIIEGIDNVYSDLTLVGELKQSINITDISHLHVVKFTFDVIYKPKCNVSITPVCSPAVLMFDGNLADTILSGTSYNVLVKDQNGNTPTYSYNQPSKELTVQTDGGSDIAEVTNSDGSFTDSFNIADNPYEIPDSHISFNGNLVDPLPATITKNIELYNNLSNQVGTVVQDDPTSLILLAPDGITNVRDSANNLLFVSSVASGDTDNPQVSDSTVVIKNTVNTVIQTETVRAQDSEDAIIANVSWTDSDGSGESTPYGVPIVCTPMINSSTIYKSGSVTTIIAEDDGATKFGRGVDWYTLGYNNYFGTTRRFTGRTGGYQSGGSYFDVNGAGTTQALAFPNDIAIDWAYWDKISGSVHWWDMTYFSSTGTNALANQPYTLHGFSDWILPNIPMHRTLYNYEFFGLSTMMNYNPFNLGGLATANRLWLSNVPSVTTNLMNFSGTDALTNNSLGTTCRVQAFRLGNTSEL